MTLDQQSVDSQSSVDQLIRIDQNVDCVSAGVSMVCRSSINQVSIKCQSRVSIKDIDEHSSVGTFSTHDPSTPYLQ